MTINTTAKLELTEKEIKEIISYATGFATDKIVLGADHDPYDGTSSVWGKIEVNSDVCRVQVKDIVRKIEE